MTTHDQLLKTTAFRSSTSREYLPPMYGCVYKARNKIATKVGSKGTTIFVLLSDSCETKFTGGKRIE